MAGKFTAFDVRVFDPHVFQIFGATRTSPAEKVEHYVVVKRRKRPTPLQRPVWDRPKPLPPPLPLPPMSFVAQPEPTVMEDFRPPAPAVDIGQNRQLTAQIEEAEDMEDILEALSIIAAMSGEPSWMPSSA